MFIIFLSHSHRKGTVEFIQNGKVNVYLTFLLSSILCMCFPGGSDGTESACNMGDPGLIPGSGRSLGERNGYPLQYSSPENAMDRGAWWTAIPEVTESDTTERRTLFTFILFTTFVICVTFVISSADSQCEDEWMIYILTLIDRHQGDQWYFF